VLLRPVNGKVTTADLHVLRALVEAGKLTPVVDRIYPLAEAGDAVAYVHEGRARGKVVPLEAS